MNYPLDLSTIVRARRLVSCQTCGAEVDRDDANATGPDYSPHDSHECHACDDARRADQRQHATAAAPADYAATVAAIVRLHERRSAAIAAEFDAAAARIRAELAADLAAIDATRSNA